MKKIKWLLLLLLAGMLTACSNKKVAEEEIPALEDNQIYAFFVNADRTDVYPVPFTYEDFI